jgi:hypothetical protein
MLTPSLIRLKTDFMLRKPSSAGWFLDDTHDAIGGNASKNLEALRPLSHILNMMLSLRYAWTSLLMLFFLSSALAQDSSDSQSFRLLQQESEERYRKLLAEIEDLQAANLALLQRMDGLERDNRDLRSKLAALPQSAISDADLNKVSQELIERIRTVDSKRAEDNRVLVKQIEDLIKATNKASRLATPKPASPVNDKPRRVPREIAEVTIEPGYTISAIAEAYRKEGYDMSADDILEANPSITDPRRIKVGDVIIIPIKW